MPLWKISFTRHGNTGQVQPHMAQEPSPEAAAEYVLDRAPLRDHGHRHPRGSAAARGLIRPLALRGHRQADVPRQFLEQRHHAAQGAAVRAGQQPESIAAAGQVALQHLQPVALAQ